VNVYDFIGQKTHISNLAEIRQLEGELLDLARQTDVKWIPAYTPPETRSILAGIQAVASSLSHLKPEDCARYITPDDGVGFNLTFSITPETIEELLTSQSLSTEGEMILRVRNQIISENQCGDSDMAAVESRLKYFIKNGWMIFINAT
jgi:hypothetical protein